ncbi:hypothetical protein CXG81DRAFT_21041 [Caulochytrium protostelioides]|uniref:Thioredoxin domain-containing protein n=1 Tax=Caulochytrium protostelioides TaxID=1555241 RepID=A0A4P9X1M9_9FUNG|nr:hypothetical protein CXG81DRAFT_21041 [Caulochytrium protostelioides]|eukprot:RKO98798.1 hypothetical protein CXG81DRAFT_21041 [Caulochytrium protostelioides]
MAVSPTPRRKLASRGPDSWTFHNLHMTLLALCLLVCLITRGAEAKMTPAQRKALMDAATAANKQLLEIKPDQFDMLVRGTTTPTTAAQTTGEVVPATAASRHPSGLWFVSFGASWCPYTMRLAPKWLEVQNKLLASQRQGKLTNAHLGRIECGLPNHGISDYCERQHHIQGVPTILIFQDGQLLEEYLDGDDVAPIWSRLNRAYENYTALHGQRLAAASMAIAADTAAHADAGADPMGPNSDTPSLASATAAAASSSASRSGALLLLVSGLVLAYGYRRHQRQRDGYVSAPCAETGAIAV